MRNEFADPPELMILLPQDFSREKDLALRSYSLKEFVSLIVKASGFLMLGVSRNPALFGPLMRLIICSLLTASNAAAQLQASAWLAAIPASAGGDLLEVQCIQADHSNDGGNHFGAFNGEVLACEGVEGCRWVGLPNRQNQQGRS